MLGHPGTIKVADCLHHYEAMPLHYFMIADIRNLYITTGHILIVITEQENQHENHQQIRVSGRCDVHHFV